MPQGPAHSGAAASSRAEHAIKICNSFLSIAFPPVKKLLKIDLQQQ
jgi:hypothetical protein